MLNILTLTTLYPNAAMPSHGIFVENRLRRLRETGEVQSAVVAPVPWFPFTARIFGSYGRFAAAPRREARYGAHIEHPRYPVLPKVGMRWQPASLCRAFRNGVRALSSNGFRPDVIDAHYFYPDGVAAAALAVELRLPLAITARGTDVNLIPRYRGPRQRIQWAADRADHVITVCQALKDALVELGVPAAKMTVLRNGVDLRLFEPRDRHTARKRYGITGSAVAAVGHLIERKGHDLIIRALSDLPGVQLLIAGEGPEEAALRRLARDLGLADRVSFLGRLAHEELPGLYTAADALVLASDREGMANVLLESMACGTPVVATDVWGTGEVVNRPEAGVLVEERSGPAIARAVRRLLSEPPDREATRRHAERFGWEETTRGQLEIFHQLTES